MDSTILLNSVQLGYVAMAEEERLPLPPVSLRIDFGERLAIIGYNGIGKSTLLRTLTREMEPLAGTVSVGRELLIGNLMQEHESLPRHMTPRELITALTHIGKFKAGNLVIGFGLSRHQADSPIAELNPGARARLLLATFSVRHVNALVLDEPTNHLDEEAVREVVASINTYDGTVVVVSHDRDFLNSLRLTRTLIMSTDGLQEIESVSTFVEHSKEAVRRVVEISFHA